MEALIARITEATGLGADVVEKAVGLILAFLAKEGPQDEVNKLLESMPGAREAVATSGDGGPGGAMGGLMGMMPGGGVMALGTKLMAAGVPMSQMQPFARELFAYGREHAGEDTMGAIVGGIPGLSQFL
ncbi:MAG: hypothetical protein JWQ36_811 [Enterovirga sp.]|jgi:hypothetical protein|nr:hypothetical protein [Enterovirga sp.]